jgi:DNA-binding FadR family transcriptional regulator
MQGACVRNDHNSIAEADINFHRLILERSGQCDLLIIWEAIIGRMHSHFVRNQWRTERLMDIYDAHRNLMETISSGDRAAAMKLLAEGIQ